MKNKIDDAATEGILTEARKNRAQNEIRVLGNDVLHDEWREVTAKESHLAHHYAQRIREDFYDNRGDSRSYFKGEGADLINELLNRGNHPLMILGRLSECNFGRSTRPHFYAEPTRVLFSSRPE